MNEEHARTIRRWALGLTVAVNLVIAVPAAAALRTSVCWDPWEGALLGCCGNCIAFCGCD
ncbi:MAG: hypothetical protein KC645_04250 [Gemmatimonadetes bacterium]|nr:hypothetical protein [Gemmatimonadota bacterium]